MPPKTTRGPRVTSDQMECLLVYIADKKQVMLSGRTHPLNANEVDAAWNELARKLNTLNGPSKTVEEWKRFLIEFKSKTKKKAREITVNLRHTGGGGKPKQLSDIEEKLMSLIGWVTITGSSELPEEVDLTTAADLPTIELTSETQANFEDQENVIIIDELQSIENEPDTSGVMGNVAMAESVMIQFDNEDVPTIISEDTFSAAIPARTPVSRKKKPKKLNNSTSNILLQSSNAFSESSRELSASLKDFSESIKIFAGSINALAKSIRLYAEINQEKNL